DELPAPATRLTDTPGTGFPNWSFSVTVTVDCVPSAVTFAGLAESVEAPASTVPWSTVIAELVPVFPPCVAVMVRLPAVVRVTEKVCAPLSPVGSAEHTAELQSPDHTVSRLP